MSSLDNKANYHPGTQISGNYPTGSYALPGNGYYSVIGAAPKMSTNHNEKIMDPKYRYSQSYRIDPIDSLLKLKQESSLTKYHHHNPPVEACRDRYLFVPTFVPRDHFTNVPNKEFTEFKRVANDNSGYHLNKVSQLPNFDYNVLPENDMNDEAYRLYNAKNPYDMVVLRDSSKYSYDNIERLKRTDQNFVSASTIPR